MANRECVENCPAIQVGFKCNVGDPVDRRGVKTFGKFCLYYPCLEARQFAQTAWINTKWSDTFSGSSETAIEPQIQVVINPQGQEETIELSPFETPRVKEAGTLPDYQMFIDSGGNIWGRSHLDKKIYSVGVDAWDITDIKL